MVRPSSSANEPRSGTPKPHTVTAVTSSTWTRPMTAKGSSLPTSSCHGADRRHDELLHGADLLLAHDAHRREQHGHHHQDHGQHRRHVEPAALEVGVVPDPRDQLDAPAGAGGPRPGAAQPDLAGASSHGSPGRPRRWRRSRARRWSRWRRCRRRSAAPGASARRQSPRRSPRRSPGPAGRGRRPARARPRRPSPRRPRARSSPTRRSGSTSSRLAALRSWSTSTVGTLVTSVLTAKPNTTSWTTGATKITGIILVSWRSCRNSLTITRHRHVHAQPPAAPGAPRRASARRRRRRPGPAPGPSRERGPRP